MESETPREARCSRRATRATSGRRPSAGWRDKEPGEPASKSRTRVPEGGEEFGPLTVERHRKDDGRALLLYELRGQAR